MVSIIIPIYNSQRFLEKCLTSIQRQSYTDIEVLCVDDGSTDMSSDIIKKINLKDSRFVYLEKTHSNAGEARNIGMTVAKGEFLLFLDSDDFFDVDLVSEAVRCAVKTNADVTVFQYKLYYEHLSKISTATYGIHTNRKKAFNLFEMRSRKFSFTNIAVWNKLYRADFVYKNNLKFKTHPAINDVYFSWHALICASTIALCRNVGVYYRTNSGSSISDNLARTSECFIKAFHEINEFVRSIGMWDCLKDDLVLAEKKQVEEFFTRLNKCPALRTVTENFELESKKLYG